MTRRFNNDHELLRHPEHFTADVPQTPTKLETGIAYITTALTMLRDRREHKKRIEAITTYINNQKPEEEISWAGSTTTPPRAYKQ